MSTQSDPARPDAVCAETLSEDTKERIVEIVEASLRRRARAELATARGRA